MSLKVLLIDDDLKLGQLLAQYFRQFEIDLLTAERPSDGLKALRGDKRLDLVILDIMLPEMDGFAVCREIRKFSEIPIIMLTARGELSDRVVGLELGADDYLPKPFEPRELVARIQTILRRTGSGTKARTVLRFGELRINTKSRQASWRHQVISLTTMEFQLLLLLAGDCGTVFSRDEILNELRGIDAELYTRSVDILVSRLRAKLGKEAGGYIRTEWGAGYRFVEVTAEAGGAGS